MQATAQRPEVVDLSTAARRLGVARPTANLMVLDGRLPARRWGQQWMIDADDLEEFAKSYQRDPRGGADPLRPETTRPLLEILDTRPGATVQELAQLMGRARRTILGWLQMLDQEGLVERHRRNQSNDPARCFLTEAGRAFTAREEATGTNGA